MVELEFSGLLSMWEQAPSWQRRAPCALYEETAYICTSLPQRMHQPLETRVEKWSTRNLQLGSWYDREYNEGRRGEGLRFDRENAHHP
jgi:hypothetical protein